MGNLNGTNGNTMNRDSNVDFSTASPSLNMASFPTNTGASQTSAAFATPQITTPAFSLQTRDAAFVSTNVLINDTPISTSATASAPPREADDAISENDTHLQTLADSVQTDESDDNFSEATSATSEGNNEVGIRDAAKVAAMKRLSDERQAKRKEQRITMSPEEKARQKAQRKAKPSKSSTSAKAPTAATKAPLDHLKPKPSIVQRLKENISDMIQPSSKN
eukprot:GDKK01034252.1.p1 GENE.GDKK01034252.1~~GDKK01034252.1.p1  ORF type:complete len:221 (+),score=20.15 GDKK01034252.1:3-665(+)